MFNWFKKKNKDEEQKEVQEQKVDMAEEPGQRPLDEEAKTIDEAKSNAEAKMIDEVKSNAEAKMIDEAKVNEEAPKEVKEEKSSFFKRMFSGLEKTRQNLN